MKQTRSAANNRWIDRNSLEDHSVNQRTSEDRQIVPEILNTEHQKAGFLAHLQGSAMGKACCQGGSMACLFQKGEGIHILLKVQPAHNRLQTVGAAGIIFTLGCHEPVLRQIAQTRINADQSVRSDILFLHQSAKGSGRTLLQKGCSGIENAIGRKIAFLALEKPSVNWLLCSGMKAGISEDWNDCFACGVHDPCQIQIEPGEIIIFPPPGYNSVMETSDPRIFQNWFLSICGIQFMNVFDQEGRFHVLHLESKGNDYETLQKE